MPRPRTVDDSAILDAAVDLVIRFGPGNLTFAQLAKQVGLSPATLVQRFATKQNLLVATAKHYLRDMSDAFEQARSRHTMPTGVIVEALTTFASSVKTVPAFVNGLAFLQLDLTEPKLYKLTLQGAWYVHAQLKKLLNEAITAHEIKACDTEKLAHTVQTTYHGALITWAVYQEGTIESWVRMHVEAVIAPYRFAT